LAFESDRGWRNSPVAAEMGRVARGARNPNPRRW
jgi:hypothetical protein